MARHLVLGSSGQIGQYVVEHLKFIGEEVIEWDIENNPAQDLRIDCYENGLLEDVMSDCDFVHFLAYDVGGSKYLADNQDSYDYIKNNMRIMLNTFEILRTTNKPFYFASSQMSNMSHSTYGKLKSVGESYTHALGGLVIHFWNVYGYESNPDKSHVITDFIRMALKDKRILVRTDGLEERNFSYAPDVAKILCEISNKYDYLKNLVRNDWRNNFPDKAIPIAALNWSSIRCIARIIAREIGDVEIYYSDKKDKIQGVKNPIPSGRWILHDNIQIPRTQLEVGIKEMIDRIKEEL